MAQRVLRCVARVEGDPSAWASRYATLGVGVGCGPLPPSADEFLPLSVVGRTVATMTRIRKEQKP